MQTYSHFIITVALNKQYKDRANSEVNTKALLLGSFMPDIPLVLLTLIFFAQRFWFGDGVPVETVFGADYDNLYFNDPLWITGHALFHAPPLILFSLTIGYYWGIRQNKGWAIALFWFAIGCGLHSAIDIVTHHDDGPLLLFPFDWKTRFISPISYWDNNHYAAIVASLEHLLDLVLLIWIVLARRDKSKTRKEAT